MRQRLESPTKGPNPLVNRTLHGMAGLGTISFLPKPAMPFRRLRERQASTHHALLQESQRLSARTKQPRCGRTAESAALQARDRVLDPLKVH